MNNSTKDAVLDQNMLLSIARGPWQKQTFSGNPLLIVDSSAKYPLTRVLSIPCRINEHLNFFGKL